VGEKLKGYFMVLLEIAACFALAMYLIRLAICYLSQIWWALLILAVLVLAGILGWRWWKDRHGGY